MRDEDVIINSGDLNTIGDTMAYLSDSINYVASNINSINGQVDGFQEQINDMKSNVATLEEEVRSFMNDIKKTTQVTSAKQSVMISQMEYDKKYGHRDDVRRRVVGLLQSVDINAVKKNTMESIVEETIVNNPDYWLAPALVALCYWYTDNKEMAQAALKKAMDRSDEKTSFLFCLVHLRANRIKTAMKWLDRFLSLQDPSNMDSKIILLLDALADGVFDVEIKDMILEKMEKWKVQLNTLGDYKQKQVGRWEEYFRSKAPERVVVDNFIKDYVLEKESVNTVLDFSKYQVYIMKKFKKLMKKNNYNNYNYLDKIDRLINILIFDYDDEEYKLKSEIRKNQDIIRLNGNIDSGNIEDIGVSFYEKKDLYTHISNACLNDNRYDINLNTKKMAIAFSKDYIIEAYNNVSKVKSDIDLKDLTIVIADWIGITENGSNELELKESLEKHINNKYINDINKKNVLSMNTIISIVVGIVGIICSYKYWFVVMMIILMVLVYNGILIYNNYKIKQDKINMMNE